MQSSILFAMRKRAQQRPGGSAATVVPDVPRKLVVAILRRVRTDRQAAAILGIPEASVRRLRAVLLP